MSPMSRSDARKREIQDRINTMLEHLELAQMGAWPHPPTEPTDQEHSMPSPTQRRHDELIAMLRELGNLLEDRLPEPEGVNSAEWDCASCGEAEPTWQHECTDVTEEPPVGSQVTDRDGDVWERFADGWTMWDDGEWGAPGGKWVNIRYCGAPLRLTTDADRERVGLPGDTTPDVDPDEALRAALNQEIVRQSKSGEVEIEVHNGYGLEAGLARVAREHINGGMDIGIVIDQREEQRDRAERAEAERDALRERLDALRDDLMGIDWPPAPRLVVSETLDRDDERGRDA